MSAISGTLIIDDDNPTQEDAPDLAPPVPIDPRQWCMLYSLSKNDLKNYPNVALVDNKVVIGRRGTCTVQIKHPAISGEHCSLKYEGHGEVWLEDLSTNGTFVASATSSGTLSLVGKGARRLLRDNDEIVLIKSAQEKIGYRIVLEKRQVSAVETKYRLIEQLGTGAFAVVCKYQDRLTGIKYAIKTIDRKKFATLNQSRRDATLMDEVNILRAVDHPNIIKIHDVIDGEKELSLVLELAEGGDLFDRIVAQEGKKGFHEDVARTMFRQMLDSIKYLHDRGIVHRDLKPENILMAHKADHATAPNDIRVTDFGLSRMLGDGSTMQTMCGTPQYLAPELESSSPIAPGYGKAVDLWAMGVILYIMLSGLAPFSSGPNGDNSTMKRCIAQGIYQFPSDAWGRVSHAAKDMVKSLICVDPNKRMTIEGAMSHGWMMATSATSNKRRAAELDGQKDKKKSATGATMAASAASSSPPSSAGQKR